MIAYKGDQVVTFDRCLSDAGCCNSREALRTILPNNLDRSDWTNPYLVWLVVHRLMIALGTPIDSNLTAMPVDNCGRLRTKTG
jgi:hypothetical protein